MTAACEQPQKLRVVPTRHCFLDPVLLVRRESLLQTAVCGVAGAALVPVSLILFLGPVG